MAKVNKDAAPVVNPETAVANAEQSDQYLTIYEVAKANNFTKAKVRTAFANHPIFKAEGVVRERAIPGTDYAPLKEARASAVAEWLEALKAGRSPKTTRLGAEGKKYIVRLPVSDANGKQVQVIVDGVTYDVVAEQAFKRKGTSGNAAAAQTAAINPASAVPPEQVTIEALEDEAEAEAVSA